MPTRPKSGRSGGPRAAGFEADPSVRPEGNASSRPRWPNVYVFNPFTEARLAMGHAFQPNRHQAGLARDLANLPQFLGQSGDLVLVPERPTQDFVDSLRRAGFAVPEYVEVGPAGIDPTGDLAPRKLGTLRPWAWGPDSLELLRPLLANVIGEARSAEQRFNPGLAQLYSKAWSANLLQQFLTHARRSPAGTERTDRWCAGESGGVGVAATEATRVALAQEGWAGESWLCLPDVIGVTVETPDEALSAIAAIRARGHARVVVKKPFGLAGQNALRLWEPGVSEVQRRWVANALARGWPLVVEPWLERELDFSVQLEMGASGLELCGYTGLLNDPRGQFQGNWAESHFQQRPPARGLELLAGPPDLARRFQQLYEDLFARLESGLRQADFVGPVGVDAFVYRAPEGGCRLKPIVEVNPRYTMGRLTVELMRQTTAGSRGVFRLVNRAMAAAAGAADFPAYARWLRERAPVRVEGGPVPRLSEGAVCLNDPERARVCLAVFEVSPGGK